MVMIILIPIFSDAFLHPLHKDNGLSLLYIKGSSGDSQMICQFHPDCTGVLEDFTWLKDKEILKSTLNISLLENNEKPILKKQIPIRSTDITY